MEIGNFDYKLFSSYFCDIVEMLIITYGRRWKNFVIIVFRKSSTSKFYRTRGPWRKPIETEGESHSTGTSRHVQVLRKHGKCIYRGNDVRRSCPFSLLLLSSKCRLAIIKFRTLVIHGFRRLFERRRLLPLLSFLSIAFSTNYRIARLNMRIILKYCVQ